MANPNANSDDASTSAHDALVKYRRHNNYGKRVPHSVEDGGVYRGAAATGRAPWGGRMRGWDANAQ